LTGATMRILVVEDCAELAGYLRQGLEAEGFEVTAAPDGTQAMARLEESDVDVVLTDVFMAEMGGIETIGRIRRKYPRLRIVAMSGRLGGTSLAAASELGANAVLHKPFAFGELLDALQAPRQSGS
jgi:DNA-binding response OmpR family regulator